MPSTIETHLDRLVTQRFLELSHNVLTPALKSAIDAMIPSMVEQLSDNMRNVSVRHHPHTRNEDSSSDTQASDSDDGLHLAPGGSAPAREAQRIICMYVAFHSYLGEKRLLKGKNGSLPQSPPIKTIQAFNHDHNCCPTLEDLSIDWSDSLKKSSWNTEVMNLLVIDFQAKIKNGTYAQTLERCRKIVAQNRHRNPDIWDTIGRIIDRLDVDGVSGDETDTPIGAIPKVVRRVGRPWLNPDITQLLHVVETYAPATHEENMTTPIGNSSLLRILEQKRAAQNSIAIQQLPRNWYNDHWYKANSTSARALLETKSIINYNWSNTGEWITAMSG
ncbi:hypothetical protein DFJ58DRAFT_841640 [Suillus subalutaceus]|uniref:uncharacterized protein n=1 Tax=Suillus subalutaceus TaxID=48586 RepID=UPI001B8685CC|nr:uncharacterized protein DFJ58DRAFT_841640 [Suillus subalutaceus]KAG1853457.1 hypothetical protein DFJ58DRAFT_841640 [Suillus subalutaceus]